MKTVLAISLLALATAARAADPAIPDTFKDPDTGATMLHLSRVPNPASGVIYFHQPCITADSRYVLVRYLDAAAGHTAGIMYRFDLSTLELTKLSDRMTRNQTLVPASGNMYYTSDKDAAIYCTNIVTKETRKVADFPKEIWCSGGVTVNADETLVVGTASLAAVAATQPILTTPPNKGTAFGDTFARHETNILFAADIKTGVVKEIHRINTWLGHTQFSPTDPAMLMFCHEGPWGSVDRIWTLKIKDGVEPEMVYKRTVPTEIAGHEFWSSDGRTAWFDNNYRDATGKHFLTGKDMATGILTRYPITAEFGSIHYVQSWDGKFFLGDGGTRKGNPETQAMYILVPKDGQLIPTKLCNMAKNDYAAAEPNPHLTPDQHWCVFTATLHGTPQAYAVEMPKQFWR